jgi:hypothetical protein
MDIKDIRTAAWKVCYWGLIVGDKERARSLCCECVSDYFEVVDLYDLMSSYCSNGDNDHLMAIANRGLVFGTFEANRRIILVCWLLEQGLFSQQEAMEWIIDVQPDDVDAPVDSAWAAALAVNEDLKYGFMRPDDDTLLLEVSKALLASPDLSKYQ